MKIIKLVIYLPLFFIINASACINDYDCGYGNQCVKASGNVGIEGVCVTPTNQYGQPTYNSQAPSAQVHVVPHCQFDTDCGVGVQCVKQDNQIYGVCMQ